MTGWKKTSVSQDAEVREALKAAYAALSEVAQTRGLDPNGEHARDLCETALRKLDVGMRRGRGR